MKYEVIYQGMQRSINEINSSINRIEYLRQRLINVRNGITSPHFMAIRSNVTSRCTSIGNAATATNNFKSALTSAKDEYLSADNRVNGVLTGNIMWPPRPPFPPFPPRPPFWPPWNPPSVIDIIKRLIDLLPKPIYPPVPRVLPWVLVPTYPFIFIPPFMLINTGKNAIPFLTKDAKAKYELDLKKGGFQKSTDYFYTNKDSKNINYKEWGTVEHKEKQSLADKIKDPKITLWSKKFIDTDELEMEKRALKGKTYINDEEAGTKLAAGLGYGSFAAGLSLSNKGFEGELSGKVSAAHAEGEKRLIGNKDYNVTAKGEADFLTAEAKLKAELDWSKGKASAEAGAMASVATAKGGFDLNLGFMKIKLGGEASVLSAGAAAKGEVDLASGKFGFSAGAGVGVFGGKLDLGIELDYKKIGDAAKGAAETIKKGAEYVGSALNKLKWW